METFETLTNKIEEVVENCLKENEEHYQDNIQTYLKPLIYEEDGLKENIDQKKTILEHIFKKISMRYSLCPDDRLIPNSFKLLEFILAVAEAEMCEYTLPLTILEELLEMQPMNVCEKLYEFLEIHKQRLLVDLKPTQGKGLVLLRLSNELIRRASKSNHNAFRGRILIFLSNSYALGERSDEDAEFYNIFWQLQKFFTNPPKIFEGNNIEIVLESINTVLENFDNIMIREKDRAKTEQMSSSSNNNIDYQSQTQIKSNSEDNNNDLVTSNKLNEEGLDIVTAANDLVKYFPKYLTSYALFDKELSDPNFRRIILFQFLVILQYLTGFFPDEKARLEQAKGGASSTNAVQLPPYDINEEQQKVIQNLWNRILQHLEEITPDGKHFARTARHILHMEKKWNYWKFAENCKDLKITDPQIDEKLKNIRKRKQELCKPLPPLKWKMGTERLTELWDTANKVNDREFMADKRRKRNTPSFEEIYNKIKEEGYPPERGFIFNENDSSEQRAEKESGWAKKWLALRVARQNYLLHFNKPAKKDAKGKINKEIEEKKDDIEALKVLIDENPTCSSSVNIKKEQN
ncbi:5573_t:CDS:10 [Entrophospora sp. SA101]|nr:5573_t:CDS:10 [Entrophospora sp. SA101]